MTDDEFDVLRQRVRETMGRAALWKARDMLRNIRKQHAAQQALARAQRHIKEMRLLKSLLHAEEPRRPRARRRRSLTGARSRTRTGT
jgi:hypothetical protein